MGRRRRAVLASVALAAALVAATGTAGVSATSADRGIQVAVADDDEAFLGIDRLPDRAAAEQVDDDTYFGDDGNESGPGAAVVYHGDTEVWVHENETTLRLLTVTNRLSHRVDVTVETDDWAGWEPRWMEDSPPADPPEPIEAVDRQPGGLTPGESGHLDAEIDCRGTSGGTVELEISAEGDGVRMEATRELTIRCR